MRPQNPLRNADRRNRRRAVARLLLLAAVVGAVLVAIAGAQWARWTWQAAGIGTVVALFVGFIGLLVDQRAQLRSTQSTLRYLRFQQKQHETAEQMAALGLWSIDLHGNTLQWSGGAFRVFGCEPADGEPTLDVFMEAINPDDRRRWNDVHKRTLRSGGAAKIEFRYRVAPGREVWVRSIAQRIRDERGRPVRLEGTVQDISGIRAMQRQLAASEAKFRDLTNLSSDWIWESDAQHRVTWLSDSVDTVLGSWARDAIGRYRWDAPRVEAFPADWHMLRQLLEARKPFENFEFNRLDESERVYHLSMSGRPVFDERNQFVGYRGTGHDITREKQQRMLLEIDGDIAAIMREQNDAELVVAAIIVAVCRKMAWIGGLRMTRRHGQGVVHEHWGSAGFSQMVASLSQPLPIADDSVEGRAWTSGNALWVANVPLEPAFASRYHAADLGAQAAFVAPIANEQGMVISALLFLGPVGYRDDAFLGQMAALLSRTLSLYLQRARAERRLRHASLHDPLTGLPNRAHITHLLTSLLAARKPLALLYIDLDRYKLINDTLGHGAGDRALVEIAQRLKCALPPDAFAGRMGGDEFVAILTDPEGREAVAASARQLLQAIEKPLVLSDRAYFLSASIGIAMAPQDSTDVSMLVKAADAAMYQVKSEGRNGARFFADDLMSGVNSEQVRLASELPLAMRRGEVELFYQPVMAVQTRRIICLEGLLRWRHPTLGLLLPERFLGAAGQGNLNREIDFWAIRRAVRDRITMGIDRHDNLAMSVNISIRQLAEDGFLANLYGLLKEQNFPPHLLRLELTESSFIEHPERTVELITELRRIGVKVVIDNFGTGYSSLSHVKNLPVDGLKIDRVFVRNLPDDRGNVAIVQAISTLAAKLGMVAMAEGIETAEELRALRELQCDVMQGSLISVPLPLSEVIDFLDAVPGLRRMHVISGSVTLQ